MQAPHITAFRRVVMVWWCVQTLAIVGYDIAVTDSLLPYYMREAHMSALK